MSSLFYIFLNQFLYFLLVHLSISTIYIVNSRYGWIVTMGAAGKTRFLANAFCLFYSLLTWFYSDLLILHNHEEYLLFILESWAFCQFQCIFRIWFVVFGLVFGIAIIWMLGNTWKHLLKLHWCTWALKLSKLYVQVQRYQAECIRLFSWHFKWTQIDPPIGIPVLFTRLT